ncbi:MAG TPA: ribosome-binding factor A, partial [Acidimicrobiia bacterium]|nr:ribosome-binding factor A [Acidimicrobiia bacterium]
RYPRTARVNEVMLEVLADELERMSEPRLELVTLTGVDVSRDLAHAKVFYSTPVSVTSSRRGSLMRSSSSASTSSMTSLTRAVRG